MLIFYALNDLPLSFKKSISLHRENLKENDVHCLCRAALVARPKDDFALSTTEDWRDYVSEIAPRGERAGSEVSQYDQS